MDNKPATIPDWMAAILGAVFANSVVVAVAFIQGAILGMPELTIAHTDPMAYHPTHYGIRGGVTAVILFLVFSIGTVGIPQLTIGAIGAVVAIVARWIILKSRAAK